MIINQFNLTKKVPDKIYNFLMKMEEKKYPLLYEKGDDDLETDVSNLLRLISQENHTDGRLRLIWLGWILCIASFPTIDWAFKQLSIDDARTDLGRQLFQKWKKSEQVDSSIWNKLNFDDLGKISPQNLSEALYVFSNQKAISLSSSTENIIKILEDSLELCLQGYAIAAGVEDRRPILNWIINYAIPYAYNKAEPHEIYTMHYTVNQSENSSI